MIVMGVAGSGKSTVGEALAARLGIAYIDGDTLHPAENVAKMSAGIPLTDDDRRPWLERVGDKLLRATAPTAIGCSALKRRYRDFITHQAGGRVLFIYLRGSKDLIASRMHLRAGHFMPTSLLDSQFAALQEPTADEHAISVDISGDVDEIVASIVASLNRFPASH